MPVRHPLRVLLAPIVLALVLCAAHAEPPVPPSPPEAPPPPDTPAPAAAPPYLGVWLREETEYPEGGAAITVVEDGPAAQAGLADDDIIVRFGGEIVRGPAGLSQKLHARKPGDTVKIVAVREGRERTFEVTLASRLDQPGGVQVWAPEAVPLEEYWSSERWAEQQQELQERLRELNERLRRDGATPLPPGQPRALKFYWNDDRPKLGVQLVEITPELRRHLGGESDVGVLVSKVLAATPAQYAGVAVGDLIVAVDGSPVASADELVEALGDKAGRSFPIEVVRQGQRITLEVTIPDPDAEPSTGPRA